MSLIKLEKEDMYTDHPAICPEHMTYCELSRWAEDHPDPWVRYLGKVIRDLDRTFPLGDGTFKEFMDEYENELSELKSAAEWAQEDLYEVEKERDRAVTKLKALQLDTSQNELIFQNNQLKERIYNYIQERDTLNHTLTVTRSNFDALQKSYKELQEKYNTWHAIST